MELNSRFLVLSLIVCCLIYVISVEANNFIESNSTSVAIMSTSTVMSTVYTTTAMTTSSTNDGASDCGSGSGSGYGSDDINSTNESSCTTTSLVTNNVGTLRTNSSLNMPMMLSTLSISTSRYFSSTIVATFTPTEDTENTDFILLRTPYLYIWPPFLLVIILMCCCLCGMCLCLYIKNRRKRRTYIFEINEALKDQEDLELSDNLFPKVDKVVTLKNDMGIESSTFGKVSNTVTTNDEGNKESTTDKEDHQKIEEGMPSEENGEARKNNVVDKEDDKKIEESKEIGEESKKDTIDKEGSKENKEGMEAKQDVEESKEVKRETKEDGVSVKEDNAKKENQTFETKKEEKDKDVTTIKDDVQTSSEPAHNESIALVLPVAVGKESNKSISDQPEIQRDEEKSISLQVDKPEEHSEPQVTISDEEGCKENKEGVGVKQDVEESKDVKRETKEYGVAVKKDDDKRGVETKKEDVGNSQKYVSEDKTAAPLQESNKETTPETNVGLQEKTPDVPKITTKINDINPIPNMQVEQTNDMTTTTTSVDKEIVKEASDISTGSTQKEDTSLQEAAKASDVGLDISFDTIVESILKSEDIKEDKANSKTTSKEEKEVQVVYL